MNCPNENTLLDFLSGRLHKADTARFREHLANCAVCHGIATDVVLRKATAYTDGGSQETEAYEPEPGSVLANTYRLESLVGRGGMGSVWLARHVGTGQEVAIKLLDAFDIGARQRFEREVRVTAAIQHEALVRIVDILPEVEVDVPALVMEYLSGSSLDRLLFARGALPTSDVRALALCVAGGLCAVHAQGVVHRDIKPANLFVLNGKPETSKILDLGLAKLLDDGLVTRRLTKTGQTVGTPPYMAPEQLAGERDVDARADVWSLGVVLYECITGERPFRGYTIAEVLRDIAENSDRIVRRVTQLGELAPTIAKMMQPSRQARFGSMSTVWDALAVSVVRP